MKFLALAALLSVSLSQAASFEGVTLSNVPTAKKTYSRELPSNVTLSAAVASLEADCNEDYSQVLGDLKKKNVKVLKTSGCSVTVRELNGCDQGACPFGTFLTTEFEVNFL